MMTDRLAEIGERYGRLHPDLEVVKEVTYLLRRVDAAEAVIESYTLSWVSRPTPESLIAWRQAKEGE